MMKIDRVLLVLVAVAALAVAGTADDSTGAGNGWLGVYTDNLSEPMLVALGVDHGVLVADVAAESPAAKAGLAVGDVILSLDGQKTDDGADLRWAVRGRPGRNVDVAIRRKGKDQTLAVVLGVRDQAEHTFSFEWPALPKEALREARRALRDLGPDLKKGLGQYDGALDSLRKEMDELRRELENLRVEVQKKAKGN
jgi:membrane-associated protease RseP (regulator of RpoE activity)